MTYARRQLERAKEAVNDSFECDKDGRPLNNSQRNIRLAIRKLGPTVRLDEFAGRELVDGLDGFGPMLDEAAATELWLKTDARFGFRPGKDFYQAVLSNTAQHNRFHPVRDYLAGLTWDGVERIGRFLPTYAGAEDTAYVGAVGRLALLAAVRRVRCRVHGHRVLRHPPILGVGDLRDREDNSEYANEDGLVGGLAVLLGLLRKVL